MATASPWKRWNQKDSFSAVRHMNELRDRKAELARQRLCREWHELVGVKTYDEAVAASDAAGFPRGASVKEATDWYRAQIKKAKEAA